MFNGQWSFRRISVSYKVNGQCSEENHSEKEYDLIALSRLAISDAKVLFDISKEKLNNPSIAIPLYQLWIAQLKLCGYKKLNSTRFSMSVVLDDSDANLTDLRILNDVALDVSIKATVVVIATDILKIC